MSRTLRRSISCFHWASTLLNSALRSSCSLSACPCIMALSRSRSRSVYLGTDAGLGASICTSRRETVRASAGVCTTGFGPNADGCEPPWGTFGVSKPINHSCVARGSNCCTLCCWVDDCDADRGRGGVTIYVGS